MTAKNAFVEWLHTTEGRQTMADFGCSSYENPIVVRRLALVFLAGASYGVHAVSNAIQEQLGQLEIDPQPHNADPA